MSQTLINWVLNNPSIDINLLLGAGGLSLILEKVLAKFHVNSKKVAFTLLHIFSLITTVATAILAHISPVDAAGIYASLAIVAGFWHRFVISGIYTKDVEPILESLADLPAGTTTKTTSSTSVTVPPSPAKTVIDPTVAPPVPAADAKPFTLDDSAPATGK